MIGSIVGYRYEVSSELPSDSTFDIYKAFDNQKGRPVKLRVLRDRYADDSAFVGELEHVCEVHESFTHPGLEKVYETVNHEGNLVIVCEHEDGAVLEDRLRRLTSFQIPGALSTAIAVAEALEACHGAGLVHGDLSARTVFSKQSDGVKLMCAGYWKAYSSNASAARGVLPAMAPYLAPEITAGSMPSVQSDIYALGILMFRVIAGRYPFLGDSPASIAQQHSTALPPSLRKTHSGVPQALDHVILRCLAKSPQDRYQSASQVVKDLRMIQDAMRFGRPIRGAADSPAASRASSSASEPIRVTALGGHAAPIPTPDAKGAPVKEEATPKGKEDGLPKWLAFLGYISVLCLVLVVVGWAYLNLSTPPSKTVPDIIGKNVQEAATKVHAMGLVMEVVEKASDKPKGEILELKPSPGRPIRENYPLRAVVSAGSLFVEVPDLRGRTLDEAKQLLSTIGLEMSKEVEFDFDPELRPNLIMQQRPSPKERIQRMSRVRVTVNTGVATSRVEVGPPKWHTYRIQIPLPDKGGDDDLKVKVELTDDEGVSVIHEGEHRPGEVLGIKVNAIGREVFFRVYVDDELWDQVSQAAPKSEETPEN